MYTKFTCACINAGSQWNGELMFALQVELNFTRITLNARPWLFLKKSQFSHTSQPGKTNFNNSGQHKQLINIENYIPLISHNLIIRSADRKHMFSPNKHKYLTIYNNPTDWITIKIIGSAQQRQWPGAVDRNLLRPVRCGTIDFHSIL